MGRTTRWFKNLFTSKKSKSKSNSNSNSNSNSDSAVRSTPDRHKWGLIAKSFRQKGEPPPQNSLQERRGSYRETIEDQDEQNKRAIAVAAATAAVAEAAVAAAHAAAAVVRLTSGGRSLAGKREEVAVIKIQSAFRGYLARRALKALRGLVKLQALVRGHIVRKQAAETLRCMHALLRVQAQARASRVGLSQRCKSERALRVSSTTAHSGPPTPEKSDQPTRSNGSRSRSDRSSPLKRNSTKSTANSSRVDRERTYSAGRNWLDQWMDEKYYDNDDKHAKILEIDSGKLIPGFPKCSPSKDSPTSIPSPQFYSATSLTASSRRGPFTPTKSECSFGGYYDCPNYMANTESFRAKSRSQSAPKQRPDLEKSGKRIPGLTSQLIQAKFANNKGYPGSGRLDRLGMPVLRH